jgi:hypothetical protein
MILVWLRPKAALVNRDSQDIPESRRKPILAGMSGEERVSVARHALLFESRLNDSPENASNNVMVRCRTKNSGCRLKPRFAERKATLRDPAFKL